MSPRSGRPKKDNAKDITIRCRVTKDLNNRLETYCEENETTKSKVMIQGIESIITKK